MAGLFLLIAWFHASRGDRLISPDVSERSIKTITLLVMRIPLVAIISICLAYVHRALALWSWLAVTLLGAIIRSRGDRV